MKKLFLVLMVLALVVSLTISPVVYAASNLIPAIKVGGGWTTVVSYVNTNSASPVIVHATYQVKNPANLMDRCIHMDRRATTTVNDLTTTVLTTTGGGTGTVFPATDTIGAAIAAPPIVAGTPRTEGFLVLESGTTADGQLSSEAIVFNLGSGFLYSQRALSTTHVGLSPGGTVTIQPQGYTPIAALPSLNTLPARSFAGLALLPQNNNALNGTLSRFMFLPPATAATGAYVIAINNPGTAELAAAEPANTTNLVAADYRARIVLQGLGDSIDGYSLGVYNRAEVFTSITQVNELVCLAQLTPDQLTGGSIPGFIVNGGWLNLNPVCSETEDGGATFIDCDRDTTGAEVGDSAIIYKVEFAPGYGFAVTPQHQQWFTK